MGFSGFFDLGSVLVVLLLGGLNLVRLEGFFVRFELGFVELSDFEVELSFLSWVFTEVRDSMVGLMSLVLFFLKFAESGVNLIGLVWFLAESDFDLINLVWFLPEFSVDLINLVWFLVGFDKGLINFVWFFLLIIEVDFFLVTTGGSSFPVSDNNLLVILYSLLIFWACVLE